MLIMLAIKAVHVIFLETSALTVPARFCIKESYWINQSLICFTISTRLNYMAKRNTLLSVQAMGTAHSTACITRYSETRDKAQYDSYHHPVRRLPSITTDSNFILCFAMLIKQWKGYIGHFIQIMSQIVLSRIAINISSHQMINFFHKRNIHLKGYAFREKI